MLLFILYKLMDIVLQVQYETLWLVKFTESCGTLCSVFEMAASLHYVVEEQTLYNKIMCYMLSEWICPVYSSSVKSV